MDLVGNITSENEESFSDENPSELSTNLLRRLLEEVSLSFCPLAKVEEIKQKLRKDLSELNINETDLIDFKLDTMEVLLHLNKDIPVDDFLKQTFRGCLDAMLCLEVVQRTSTDKELTSLTLRLVWYFQQALQVLAHVLEVQGWSVPDAKLERRNFQEILQQLLELTDEYLKEKPNYSQLKRHEKLIRNFQLMKEVAQAIEWLRYVFEELRHNLDVVSCENEFVLHDEVEEHWFTYETIV